jgi:YD repeat-containing protein
MEQAFSPPLGTLPPPRSAYFIISDANGQALAYVYFEEERLVGNHDRWVTDWPQGETLSVRRIRLRFSASVAANPAGDACPSCRPGGAVGSRFVSARSHIPGPAAIGE